MNYFKTFLLIFILTSLFMVVGYALGGINGALIALGFAAIMNMIAYWNSDKMVIKMTGAQIADPSQYKQFYNVVSNLAATANIPMPKLYIMHQDTPNAFATGRNPANAAVAITTGIWQLLSQEELSGVIAHELAHIKNRDILISTIAATFAGAISMLANMFMFMNLFGGHNENRPHPIVGILVMIVAPIGASIMQMAVSRQREYQADKLGGALCGNPLYLAAALKKLEEYNRKPHNEKNINPSTAHMFIVNPFAKSREHTDSLFSTHPNTFNRIIALEKQAQDLGIISYEFRKHDLHSTEVKNEDTKVEKTVTYIDKDVPNNPWL